MIKLFNRVGHVVIRTIVDRMGYRLASRGEGYFDAPTIIKKAKEENLSVTEYLEKNNIGVRLMLVRS